MGPNAAEKLDPVELAFENAKPLDEPLSDEERAAIDAARAEPGEGVDTATMLARLRPRA